VQINVALAAIFLPTVLAVAMAVWQDNRKVG